MPNGNSTVIKFLQSPLGRRLGKGKTIVLHYTGPKSGKAIELPVWAARQGDRWIVAVGWADRKKWFHAFKRPLEARITSKGKSYDVTGRLVDGTEAEEAREAYLLVIASAKRTMKGDEPIVVFEPR